MYRLFGMEVSPYSVKVRAMLRYKGVAHEWIVRSRANEAAFREHARLPIIPLLVTPDGQGMQDSTPLLDYLEKQHPEPAVRLSDPALNFIANALEEAADEWLIKIMFHFRWNHEADRQDASLRIARASVAEGTDPLPFAQLIGGHLMTRRAPLGCTDANAALLESSLNTGAHLLDQHLARHDFLFGAQLSVADLGMASMYCQLLSDPTPAARLAGLKPLQAWVTRTLSPAGHQGQPAEAGDLLATLLPLLHHELSDRYLPWASANAAHASAEDAFSASLQGTCFSQPPQKYTAKSWRKLQADWQSLPDEARQLISEWLGPAAACLEAR